MTQNIHNKQFGNQQRWLKAKNVGATTITAYAVVEVTGITDDALTEDKVWTVQRPTSATPSAVAICGPKGIAASAYGSITFDEPFFILVDSGTTPAVGTTLGPKNASFETDNTGDYFLSLSAALTSPKRVLAKWNTSPGGRPYIGLTDGTITARSGTTLGSGTVSLYHNSGTTLSDSTTNVTAYNFGANSIAGSTYVQVEQFAPNGDWFITAVDCGV